MFIYLTETKIVEIDDGSETINSKVVQEMIESIQKENYAARLHSVKQSFIPGGLVSTEKVLITVIMEAPRGPHNA